MIRIIVGVLLLIGMLNSAIQNPSGSTIANPYEAQGYMMGKVLIFVLAAWLIYSGIKQRQLKKSQTVEKKQKEVTKKEKPNIVPFLRLFFMDYKAFLSKYIKLDKPPYWLLFLLLMGGTRVLISMHYAIVEQIPNYPVQDWFSMLFFSLIGGIILGFIIYWVVGSIFHLGVLIAGGEKGAKASRMIYLYSGIPLYLTITLHMLINMVAFESEYFLFGGSYGSIRLGIIAISLASLYGIWLAYIAARITKKTKKIHSILLFIALPIAVQVLLLVYT